MGIKVNDLHFSYGQRQVLKGLSFEAGTGELITLLGPNGTGKSTLMRCILGFLKNFDGTVTLSGRDVRSMTRRELSRQIAYIPQSAPAVFNYNVLDTVLMGVTGGLGLMSTPNRQQQEKALYLLESLGIADLASRGCEELSGGERQLVLLARALMQDARNLIMDEPTANLDYGNQNRVMERVASLASGGYTVLLSTHDPNQALLYASRALVLYDGQILADGAPEKVLTEKTLQTIYGIGVRRYSVGDGDMLRTVCVPERRAE